MTIESSFKVLLSPIIKFYFIKGVLHNLQKKNQRMNGPTILDSLHNSRCGKHVCWAYFLSGDILIKHYGTYSRGFGIWNYATEIPELLKTTSYSRIMRIIHLELR